MKVTREKVKAFTPINIKIESQEELEYAWDIFDNKNRFGGYVGFSNFKRSVWKKLDWYLRDVRW